MYQMHSALSNVRRIRTPRALLCRMWTEDIRLAGVVGGKGLEPLTAGV